MSNFVHPFIFAGVVLVFLVDSLLLTQVHSFHSDSLYRPLRHQQTQKNKQNTLHLFQELLSLTPSISSSSSTENGLDPEYPWSFSGRLWFRPALVKAPTSGNEKDDVQQPPPPPPSVTILQIFGWTIGGSVALEYDDSPVGPYREYVTMGALVSKRGSLGQWGSKLYVNTKPAEDVCRSTWNVPAELANIDFFSNDKSSLSVVSAPDSTRTTDKKQTIQVGGWEQTRVLKTTNSSGGEKEIKRNGGLPVLWTPSIKALWAPLVPLPSSSTDDSKLPLHRLRLSASAIRLTFCPQKPNKTLGIPIPIGLVVDNVLIEIGRENEEPL